MERPWFVRSAPLLLWIVCESVTTVSGDLHRWRWCGSCNSVLDCACIHIFLICDDDFRFGDCMMKNIWKVQDANDRFDEMLETSLSEGPQIVTRRCVETAVLVSMEQWRGLTESSSGRGDLKELLLSEEARTDDLVPPRTRLRLKRRPASELE